MSEPDPKARADLQFWPEHRPGATGGHFGAVPPQTKIVPPKRGPCPEEINRLGAIGVQIEDLDSQIGVYRPYFCNFCGLTPDFINFWDEGLLFFFLVLS